jgi:hypothetical protein
MGTVVTAPIPPFQNLPIRANFYNPSRFLISNIILGQTTIITATEDMNYVIGQLVRLIIPAPYGTYQLDNRQAYVISIPSDDQVEIDIDSNQMNAFILASISQQPQILPIGDVNSGVINNNGLNAAGIGIPGAFINLS